MAQSIIVTLPYSLGLPGGGPLDCLETARHLSKAGAQVSVLPVITHRHSWFPRSPVPQAWLGTAQERELAASGVDVIGVHPNSFHYSLDGIGIRKAVAALASERRVDAVLSYWQEALYLPPLLRERRIVFGIIAAASYALWLFGEQTNPPHTPPMLKRMAKELVIAPLRQHLVRPAHRCKAQLIVGRSLRRADVVFARSERTRTEVVDLFNADRERVKVTYCGVDPVFFAIDRRPTRTVSQFIYYGALVRRKGAFDVLNALGRLAAEGIRDWTLKVAGWGDEAAVRSVARAQGIAAQVSLLGPLDRAALLKELAWAHLAILPSHAESFGLAIAEAQAAGLPVVAFEAGAVPEVVLNGKTGWLTPVGDAEQLANSIRAAMADPESTFSMGMAARERIRGRFSWERSAREMLDEIEKRKIV